MAASGYDGHVADLGQAVVWPQGVRVPGALGANKWWIGLCECLLEALLLFWSSLWSEKWAHTLRGLWLAALISDWSTWTLGQAVWLLLWALWIHFIPSFVYSVRVLSSFGKLLSCYKSVRWINFSSLNSFILQPPLFRYYTREVYAFVY